MGQCGNQIGTNLLHQILQEYEIQTNESNKTKLKTDKACLQQNLTSFFTLKSNFDKRTFETLQELIKSKAKARVSFYHKQKLITHKIGNMYRHGR